MHYSIQHTTRFRYSTSIYQSVMEVRMQPRTENIQQCTSFELAVSPHARITSYCDYLGNTVHTFDIPNPHRYLTITAESLVSVEAPPSPPEKLDPGAWAALDALVQTDDYWEMLMPSERASPTGALQELAAELGVYRRDDPLSLLHRLNEGIFRSFKYVQSSTTVDSPIDDALNARAGVCQDFAHIMIALVRHYLKIPCRYVSGYLFHRRAAQDRSAADASHAWVEAFLPDLGWVGFDPTNNLIAAERHIRVAVGRDYSAVPPTRGVFKGSAESELGVVVQVHLVESVSAGQEEPDSITYLPLHEASSEEKSQQEQQQQ